MIFPRFGHPVSLIGAVLGHLRAIQAITGSSAWSCADNPNFCVNVVSGVGI